MTDSTATEQPAGESLRDDLEAVMSGYDDEMNEITETENLEVEEVEEAEDLEVSEEVEEEAEETEEEPAEEEVEAVVEAPDHWAAADKERFAAAPPELQSWLLERHKSMEGDYTRKSQEIAETKKNWEPVQEIFAPHMDQLRANGQTPASVIQYWASVENALRQDPAQALRGLAQQYGVTLGEQSADDTYIDPQVQSMQQELRGLKQQVQQREQHEENQRRATTNQDIESFQTQKTEAGELAHPHFDDVMDDMKTLAEVERANGRTPKLGDLYEKAVWANPTVREKVLAAQQHAAAKKAESVARAKAAKAKGAKKTLRASPDGNSSSDLSLRDELSQMMN